MRKIKEWFKGWKWGCEICFDRNWFWREHCKGCGCAKWYSDTQILDDRE